MRNFLRKNYLWVIFTFLLIVSFVVLFFYFYQKDNSSINEKKSQTEAKQLYDRVNKHFLLPTDELPTIATVTDPEKLKGQAFFSKAKTGDKVLIFTNAKEAILYSPSLDKIISVAPLNIDENKIKESAGTESPLLNSEF